MGDSAFYSNVITQMLSNSLFFFFFLFFIILLWFHNQPLLWKWARPPRVPSLSREDREPDDKNLRKPSLFAALLIKKKKSQRKKRAQRNILNLFLRF